MLCPQMILRFDWLIRLLIRPKKQAKLAFRDTLRRPISIINLEAPLLSSPLPRDFHHQSDQAVRELKLWSVTEKRKKDWNYWTAYQNGTAGYNRTILG